MRSFAEIFRLQTNLTKILFFGISWTSLPWVRGTISLCSFETFPDTGEVKLDGHSVEDFAICVLFLAGPGAMCYSSSILRGVTAVLLSFWDSCREKSAADAPKQLNTTCRLISCMRKVS